MKFSRLSAVSVMAVAMSCALTACSSGDDASTGKSASATSQAGSQAAKIAMPTPEDLNAVLNLAADPNAPIEQRTQTVQNGESASDLFPVMTKLRDESHAQFQVVNPILPGYSPNSVLAKVNLVLPDKEPQAADNVEFVYENGKWKLAQSWACTLIEYTVPDQAPPMCSKDKGSAAPAPAPAAPAPAESNAPAPAAPAGGNNNNAPAPAAPVAPAAPAAPAANNNAPAPAAPAAPEAPANNVQNPAPDQALVGNNNNNNEGLLMPQEGQTH